MRLTHVSVEGIGRFQSLTRIDGLRPGVNILAAGNEAGKSTLFRAIRACLFERHGTKTSDVMALATEGVSLPATVTLGFEHGGKAYEITKSFVKSPSASLRCDGREIARNRDADEKLWEILGIAQGSSRSVDEAAFGILWVSQGQSFHVPEPSEAATSTLNAAIQQEVGTLVGGERARQVLADLKSDLSRQLTETGRPKANGPLAEAARQCETLAAELETVESRLKDLDTNLDDLARLRAEQKQLADPGETARLKQEHVQAAQDLNTGEDAAKLLLRCEQDERQAHALLTAQQEQLKALIDLCKRIDDNRLRSVRLNEELAPLDAEVIAARNKVAEAYAEIRRIDSLIAAIDDEDRQLQRGAALAQKSASRDGLQMRLDALQDYQSCLARTEAALKANTVDQQAIATLEDIESKQALLMAKLEAAAAQLTIEQRGAGGGSVTVNGMAVTANTVRAVTEPLSIRIGETLSITVSPPQSGLAASGRHKNELRQQLDVLLTKHGAGTPAELRQSRAARVAHEDALRGLTAERKALGLKDLPSAEIAQLTMDLAQIDAEAGNILSELNVSALPSLGEIGEKRALLGESRAQLWAARIQSESSIVSENATITRIGTTRSTLQGQLNEIAGQLDADLAALPDGQRRDTLEAAERQSARQLEVHRIAAAALARMRRDAPPPEEIERRRNRLERLISAIAYRTAQIDKLNQRIANLEGQVQTAGGDGLGERAAELRAQSELAQSELARQTARIDTLKLLRNVVQQSYDTRREQLHAPLRRHLRPFLHDVFPQAEVELGDGFAISGLRRTANGTEIFERLSAGTQEQIAVLVRLAMGAMICERGQQVPIILDDALVFSDDTRIEQMFDALNRAARNQQVIIFTCRTRTFSTLGGTPLIVTSG